MIEEQKGIAEAESLLEDLGFDTLPIRPHEVTQAIDSDDFRVVMELQNFDSEKILGKAEGNSQGALVYINSNIPDAGRLNFTAAHEIGHVCMHIMSHTKMVFACGSKELSNPFNDPIEKEANGFASGLLMPRKLIRPFMSFGINWGSINNISTNCGSSLEASFRRLILLEKDPIAFVIHHNGKFKRFIASDSFEFYIQKSNLTEEQKELLVDTKINDFPSDFDEVDAIDWVNPENKDYVLTSLYASSVLLNDGYSYSLITYDEDCLNEKNN